MCRMCKDRFRSFFLRSGLKFMDMRVLLQAFTCAGVDCIYIVYTEPRDE